MTKDKYVINKTKRYPYYILMLAILIWFVAMEIFGANERMIDMGTDPLIYSGSFTWQKQDGSAESVDVPGTLFHSCRRDYDSHDDTSR